MLESPSSTDLARRARLSFADQLAEASPRLFKAILTASQVLLDKPAERSITQQRRDTVQALMRLRRRMGASASARMPLRDAARNA